MNIEKDPSKSLTGFVKKIGKPIDRKIKTYSIRDMETYGIAIKGLAFS